MLRLTRTSFLTAVLAVGVAQIAPPALAADARDPARGRLAYMQSCASCHGAALEGAGAPPLAGVSFQARWAGRATEELYNEIALKMPPNAVGTLPPAQLRNITRYIVAQNGYPRNSKRLDGAASSVAAAPVPVPPANLPAPPKYFGAAGETGPVTADLARGTEIGWPMYNGDYHGRRYSPLGQITPGNVATLAPKCIFQTGEVGSFQSSPVLDRNRLYVTTAHNTYAIDAATCKKLWVHHYVPEGPEGLAVNRGVAIYDGRILRGTPDGHLLALDAATGKLLWDVWVNDSRKGYNLSAAPAAFDGKVFIGEGGADRGATGHIYAFDIATGRLLWTFNAVPTGKEPGAETWGNGAQYGGGSSWTTITVDPATRRIYAPIGNPGSSLEGSVRPGANLYTNSTVVLDADTGKLDWYIQQVPHDLWDWDTAAAPMLYEAAGRSLMAVASKDGWLYIYDQKTRALVAKQETTRHLNADKPPTPEGVRVCPGTLGGTEWYGPAFDPQNKMLFVNTVDWCATLIVQTNPRNSFGGTLKLDPPETAKGWLRGFDAGTGDAKWVYESDTPMVAAITTTASGLIFTGSLNGEFLGLAARSGEVLYRFNTGGALAGGISTYAVNGKQFVAVASGNSSKTIWGTTGAATVIIFGLPEPEQKRN